MTERPPAYQDELATAYQGDCLEVLRTLLAESVHCVVTSPPYWGLRDYGTATWVDGDPACDHSVTMPGGPKQTPGVSPSGHAAKADRLNRRVCGKCGAIRVDSQLGLEPTHEEYLANMVAVFREVRRVLRSDGTLWLNLGDSYVSGQGGRQSSVGELPPVIRRDRPEPKSRQELVNAPAGWAERAVTPRTYPGRESGLKPKDLYGMPWRVAFALQADGWYLRSDIIWSKPNPMPESVTDRPTKAHEYLFLLSRAPRYFYDAEAIREAQAPGTAERYEHPYKDRYEQAPSPNGYRGNFRGPNGPQYNPAGRNRRSVWTIATQPYPEAHFATFPEKLVEPCVLAGCPVDGVVLDPFAGSGTTLAVAKRLGRRSIGIELNAAYLDLIRRRVSRVTHQPALFDLAEAAG